MTTSSGKQIENGQVDSGNDLRKQELPNATASQSKFKKRSRPTGAKTRKKAIRNSFITSPTTSQPQDQVGTTNISVNRIREQFTVSKVDDERKNEATSHRLDIATSVKEKDNKKPFGPVKAPSHLRASVRMDYQPDVCKDYKETGYCGFGDACKFLHDRSDYKAGWQLDKEWTDNRNIKMKGADDVDGGGGDVDDDGLPFACFICRKEFKQPVMTLCNHFFCEDCALDRMRTVGTCAVCGKQMRGTLNTADRLLHKLELTKK